MRLSTRQLNRATLARQLLLDRQPLTVEDAVRRVLALQAQHPASPYLGLWNRVAGFDPAELDAAFTASRLLRSRLIRMTLHVQHRDDHAAAWAAMQPSLRSRLGDARFTASGWTVAELDAFLPELLAFLGEPRRATAIVTWLQERCGDAAKGLWWAYRYVAPLWHAPGQQPWSFPEPGASSAFVAAAPGSLPTADVPDAALGLQALARRYLQAFGPATAADLAQFAQVQRGRAKEALDALSDELERFDGPDKAVLYDTPGAPLPDEGTTAPPRLLPMWDNVMLAHADRSRVIPTEFRALVTRVNGDVLPTLLIDGEVAGVWRPAEGGIEATAFRPLPEAAWDGLAGEAQALLSLLAGREPRVYRRYEHWWRDLPGAQVRMLPH